MEVGYHLPYKLVILFGICLSFSCDIANIRQYSVHLLILVALYDCHPDYQQKVSGCFRTDSGADDFAKLHSIAETAMKNGKSKGSAILAVVQQ